MDSKPRHRPSGSKIKIELSNSFHNTRVTVASTPEIEAADGIWDWLRYAAHDGDANARRRLARIKAALCGSSDCCCGVVR
jgi:hypothetical protein